MQSELNLPVPIILGSTMTKKKARMFSSYLNILESNTDENIADYQQNAADVFPHTKDFIMLVKLSIDI